MKIFVGILAGVLLCAAMFYALYHIGRERETKREQVAEIVTFSSLPEGAVVEASIDMNGRTEPVSFSDGKLILSFEQQKNFHLPYVLRASVKKSDDTYYDFWWDVGQNGAEYYAGASGFKSLDQAYLFLNNVPSGEVRFDWAGRIEFAVILNIVGTQKNCVYVERKAKDRIGTCHYAAGKLGA